MVAQYRIPLFHEMGVSVYKFIIGHPQRVVNTLYTSPVMGITSGDKKFRFRYIYHPHHSLCHIFLTIVAISSQIANNVKVIAIIILNLYLYPFALRVCKSKHA
jgi:hypothetical protein